MKLGTCSRFLLLKPVTFWQHQLRRGPTPSWTASPWTETNVFITMTTTTTTMTMMMRKKVVNEKRVRKVVSRAIFRRL